jgi:hypothetical protein
MPDHRDFVQPHVQKIHKCNRLLGCRAGSVEQRPGLNSKILTSIAPIPPLLPRLGAYQGKGQPALVAFPAFGVGYLVGTIETDRTGGKVFWLGYGCCPFFAFAVFYGDLKKSWGFGIFLEWFRHKLAPW